MVEANFGIKDLLESEDLSEMRLSVEEHSLVHVWDFIVKGSQQLGKRHVFGIAMDDVLPIEDIVVRADIRDQHLH